MKILISIAVILISVSISSSQQNLNKDQWKEDIHFLQEKVNKDYNFLFKKITKEKFDNEVDQLIQELPELEDHEVIVRIAELVALFKYGHTALWLTSWRYNQSVNFHQMPYNLYQFKEGVFIQGVHKDYEMAAGAKVIKVGNIPIEEAMARVKPVVSAENDQFFKAHGLNYLGVPEVLNTKGIINDLSSVTLTLEKENKQFKIKFEPRSFEKFPGYYSIIQTNEEWVDARGKGPTPYWLKNLEKKYYYEFLQKEKILYVRQSEVQDDGEKSLEAFYEEVFQFVDNNEVEKLVLDFRLNSGGNNYKNKPLVTGLIKSEKINQSGKLFVILGRRTFSACQNLVNEIENYTNATFVGEPTAENVNFFGDSRTETLPNSKLPIRLSYLWWQDKDPRDNRPWTAPHIAVDLSFDEYVNNIDPVLEVIKNTTEVSNNPDPWTHLAELFGQGKLDQVTRKAKEYVKDPAYQYFDFEGRMNDAAYSLMGNKQLEPALFILKLNTELFPQSANCWDSYAEALWNNGQMQEAKKCYSKAIQLDPDGEIGENAIEMLQKIEGKK